MMLRNERKNSFVLHDVLIPCVIQELFLREIF